jgi:hypothetical protein
MRRTLSALFAISRAVPAIAGAQTTDPSMPTAEATAAPPASSDPLAPENWPLSGVDRPLSLSAGMLQLDVNGGVGLNKGSAGEPFAMPLNVWYGITNELQAALISSGLCLSGTDGGCTKVFDNIGLNVLLSLFGRGSSLEVATWAQLNYASIDAGTMNLQVGGAFNWVTGGGNIAVIPLPNVQIGLAERDYEGGNKEYIGIPTSVYFRAGEKIAPVLFTGLGPTSLDAFGDSYTIPVGVGVLVGLNRTFDVGARFDMPRLIAGTASGADSRSLTAWVSVRPL